MQVIADVVAALDSFLWGLPLILLLFGTHLFLTIRLRFPQRHIFKAIKLSFSR
ncbi:MAG TPA: sodium:alanine symporter family protein, partial [bacterium]|nr:sodium:alanine symporter family protein [bacterium]